MEGTHGMYKEEFAISIARALLILKEIRKHADASTSLNTLKLTDKQFQTCGGKKRKSANLAKFER